MMIRSIKYYTTLSGRPLNSESRTGSRYRTPQVESQEISREEAVNRYGADEVGVLESLMLGEYGYCVGDEELGELLCVPPWLKDCFSGYFGGYVTREEAISKFGLDVVLEAEANPETSAPLPFHFKR